jgi:thiamine biosynthesis lipoprotein
MQKIIDLKDGSITTSGNYRRYHESGGKKYTHIIDPRTGMPAQNEIISITVFAEDAITADAYDNALLLMGIKEALRFVNSRNDLAAFIIYKNDEGAVVDTASVRFNQIFFSKTINRDNN